MSKEKYLTKHSPQNDRSVVTKPSDKGSAVVVWDRTDYLKEAGGRGGQLSDEKTYKEIRITDKDQVELVEKSSNLFSNLRRKNQITESENSYFRFKFKKATNLNKFYLIPKIHKGLCKVTGRQSFPTVEPLLKSFRILGSKFTAYNETRRVLYKRHRGFFSKT